MTKFFSLFAVATLALTGSAVAADQQSFTKDGTTYIFTSTKTDAGDTVLTGRAMPGDVPFRLLVRKGRVSGQSNGVPVSFSVSGARGASAGASPVIRTIQAAD